MSIKSAVIVAVLCGYAWLAPAATYHVATNGNDTTGDGSAGLPYLTISNGIAKALNAGDVVLVSNGVYVLEASLAVQRGIILRAMSTNPLDTLVDGNYPNVTNRCLYVNHADALIAGFTFSNGFVASGGSSVGVGAYVGAGTISNCWIVFNASTMAGAQGGGLMCLGANASAWNCVISNNHTTLGNGAGVLLRDGASLFNSAVVNNYTGGGNGAGGVYSYGNATCIISNCLVSGNQSTNTSALGRGGGIYTTNALVVDCEISGNYSSGQGGGVYLYYGGMLDRCRVVSNTAYTTAGGAYVYRGGLMRNCLVSENRLTAGSSYGGGVCAATYTLGDNPILIDSCTIASNQARTCAGLSLGNGSAGTSNVFVTNCVVWLNTHPDTGAANDLFNSAPASNVIAYCCLPNDLSAPNHDNLTNNPAFVSPETGDFRLASGSPCINAGANLAWMEGAADLDGRRRLDYFHRQADMGCYEHVPAGALFGVR